MMKKAFEGKLKKLDSETHKALKKAKEAQAKAEAARDAGVNNGEEHWVCATCTMHYFIIYPVFSNHPSLSLLSPHNIQVECFDPGGTNVHLYTSFAFLRHSDVPVFNFFDNSYVHSSFS
jgi:hypothetical protein